MMLSRKLALRSSAVALLSVLLTACGGSSSSDQGPGAGSPDAFEVIGDPVPPGSTWQLNRPIDIRFTRAVAYQGLSMRIQDVDTGWLAAGSFGPGVDPDTGADDPTVVRFTPVCPTTLDGSDAGFIPGATYRLEVRGEDSGSTPVFAADGTPLALGWTGEFDAASGSDPATLFYDPIPGPPRPAFRGRDGVSSTELDVTRIELGSSYAPTRIDFQTSFLGGLVVDPFSQSAIPDGLPLNHSIAPQNTVAVVVVLDQQLLPDPAQLERFGLDYLDGTWRPIKVRSELLQSCSSRGSTVRIVPVGTLPPGAVMRLRLDPGLADISGEALTAASTETLPAQIRTLQDQGGARVDAVFDSFWLSGDEPGSMEDTTSDLGAPRAFWGDGIIAGIDVPGSISRARSKWYPLGLAGQAVGAPRTAPTFAFHGVDDQGRVRASGGLIDLEAPLVGPVAPSSIQQFEVDLPLGSLMDPLGLYQSLPSLLRGTRLRFGPGTSVDDQVLGAEVVGSSVRLAMGSGCYNPLGLGDCAPWDLASIFASSGSATIQCHPQSFEIWKGFFPDLLSEDHSVQFRFDATVQDANGNPDESAAFSASGPWASDIAALSGANWDFVRFEVEFNLDVSGDGYDPAEIRSVVDFVKIPVDFR